MLRRAVDDILQHRRGVLRLTRDREGGGQDPQIFGFAYRILELPVDGQGALDFLLGKLSFTTGDVNLRQAGDCLRSEQPVAQAVRFTDRLGGDLHGAAQLTLLAVDDPEVVPRLDDAALELRLVIGGDSAGVGNDGPLKVALQSRDDAEVVGAPADRGHVVVVRRLFLGACEEVGGFIDTTPLERDRAAHVQGAHFHHPVLQRPRP